MKTNEDVARLTEALKKEREKNRDRKGLSDEDAAELERLRTENRAREEEEAKKAGKWDELRGKLQKDHERELEAERAKTKAEQERNAKRDRRMIRGELAAQLAKVGAKAEYLEALEAMIEKKHRLDVEWGDDDVQVVVVDEVHGNRPLDAWMGEWAKSEAASPFMPPENGGGGGANGTPSKGRNGKSWEGKKFGEMTSEEQVAFTNEKYGSGAAV